MPVVSPAAIQIVPFQTILQISLNKEFPEDERYQVIASYEYIILFVEAGPPPMTVNCSVTILGKAGGILAGKNGKHRLDAQAYAGFINFVAELEGNQFLPLDEYITVVAGG